MKKTRKVERCPVGHLQDGPVGPKIMGKRVCRACAKEALRKKDRAAGAT